MTNPIGNTINVAYTITTVPTRMLIISSVYNIFTLNCNVRRSVFLTKQECFIQHSFLQNKKHQ